MDSDFTLLDAKRIVVPLPAVKLMKHLQIPHTGCHKTKEYSRLMPY